MELRRKVFGDVVGSADLILAATDGTRTPITIRVGRPYQVDVLEWACPVEVHGLEPRYPDMHGTTSLQALCLAVAVVRERIRDVRAKGGKVLAADEDVEWDDDALAALFGLSSDGSRHNAVEPVDPAAGAS
jgi:hypothetical protein